MIDESGVGVLLFTLLTPDVAEAVAAAAAAAAKESLAASRLLPPAAAAKLSKE